MIPSGFLKSSAQRQNIWLLPWMPVLIVIFSWKKFDGKPKLKRTHKYYSQVQGLMGVTGAKWCDFVVYTSRGMSIERIPFDPQFWNELKGTLKMYYFKHFLALEARELNLTYTTACEMSKITITC